MAQQVKALVTKPRNLSSILGHYRAQGGNLLLHVVHYTKPPLTRCPLTATCETHTHSNPTNKYIDNFLKKIAKKKKKKHLKEQRNKNIVRIHFQS